MLFKTFLFSKLFRYSFFKMKLKRVADVYINTLAYLGDSLQPMNPDRLFFIKKYYG
jgi:hypothetical protein